MIRGKEIINPARSQSWVRTTLIFLPMSVFREICLPVSLMAQGSSTNFSLIPDPKLNIGWWDFFFLNCVIENRFLVSFFFLLNPILSGFGLSKAPAGIILYHCVKFHLKNKLLFKIIHMVGYWNALSALWCLLYTIVEKVRQWIL